MISDDLQLEDANGKYLLYWFKENQIINNGETILWKKDKYSIIKSTNSLQINDIQTAEDGTYSCYFRGISYFGISVTVFGKYILGL